jgi:hypothetical protein
VRFVTGRHDCGLIAHNAEHGGRLPRRPEISRFLHPSLCFNEAAVSLPLKAT